MKTVQKLLTYLTVLLMVFSYACSKKNDPVGCNYVTELQPELTAVNNAANAYVADPNNSAKCQAWKDAYQTYLTGLQDHIDCATLAGQQAELQSSINQAQSALDQIQC
jgi:hypothetical protein